MKLGKIILWSFVAILGVIVCFLGYVVINSARGFLDPMAGMRILREYRASESDSLLSKIRGIHLELDEDAVIVLTERKEKRLVEPMIGMLNSRFPRKRKIALRSLANFDDERIVDPVMQHAEKKKQRGEMDYEYGLALLILSKFNYEEAWPYVLELAQAEDALSNGSARMLKYFGKPEGIVLLRAMEKKIAKGTVGETAQRRMIEEAIQHLEAIQEQKNAQTGAA